jgi:DNA polymerase III subunit gamma/tau
MSQALYRKWRPHLWGDVVGQEHVVRTIQNAVRGDRVGHAYLLSGPRGTGKTTTARLLAKAVNCLAEDRAERPCNTCEHCLAVNNARFLDLIEIDAASNTSVDDVRDLRDKINFAPSLGRFKVYIIDEVHMLSTAAFNALLKTLEEPPPHAIFVLATTEMHKIPATVLSRCQQHEFRRIPVNDIVTQLRSICKAEKIKIEKDALTLIARQATGSLRDGISLLDQLASTGEAISLNTAQQVLGTATGEAVTQLTDAILERDAAAGLNCIHQALDSGSDPRQYARQVVTYLRSLLLIKLGNAEQVDATEDMRVRMAAHSQAYEMAHLLRTIELFNRAATDARGSWHPGLPLELSLAEAISGPAPPAAGPTAPAAPAAVAEPTAKKTARKAPDKPEEKAPKKADEKPSESGNQPPDPASEEELKSKPKPKQSKTKPEPEPESAPEPPPADGKVSLKDVIAHWKQIGVLVKQHRPNTVGLLNSCKPLRFKGETLVLGFKTPVLKSKMETDENLALTAWAIEQALGVKMKVTCTVMGSNASTDVDADGDGMVNEALNLGGKIAQKRKIPPNTSD